MTSESSKENKNGTKKKICVRCRKEKAITSFGKSGKVCYSCKNRRRKENNRRKEQEFNRIENIIGKNGVIQISQKSGKWDSEISIEEAKLMLKIGCVKVVNTEKIIFHNNQTLRKFVFERDNYTCAYCGKIATTVDHIKPKSEGGIEIPSNLISSCGKCNFSKSSMSLEEFLSKDKRRYRHFNRSGYAIFYKNKNVKGYIRQYVK